MFSRLYLAKCGICENYINEVRNLDELFKKIEKLEYHQQLLVRMMKHSKEQLYYLIIEKNLSRKETEQLLKICEDLSIELKKQKAEGYVTSNPLLIELKSNLTPSISPKELIQACLEQGIYVSLMKELQKSL